MKNPNRASELVTQLQTLAKTGRVFPPNLPRKGEDTTADQLPVFGELLVVLAEDLDRAEKKIQWLTWVITALTAVLVIDAIVRLVIRTMISYLSNMRQLTDALLEIVAVKVCRLRSDILFLPSNLVSSSRLFLAGI